MTITESAHRPFIGGTYVTGEGPALVVNSPATEQPVARVESASPDQIIAAIGAARRAFDEGPWPTMSAAERVATMLRFGEELEARREQLVDVVVAETGCPIGVTRSTQVGLGLASVRELCDLYAQMPEWEHNEAPLADHLVGSSVRLSIRRYEPGGVVAAITPYNFPTITNIWKIVPAMLAGCSVVLRPSPLTPVEAVVLGEAAAAAGVPDGVLNIVPDVGHEGGVILTTDPGVDIVSFTGSGTVGRMVAAQASGTLKRVILELGGKSVQLHLPDMMDDANFGDVVAAAVTVYAAHAGQGCALQTRLLVPEASRERVVEAVTAAARALPVGDPLDPSTLVGPLVSQAQRDKVHGIVSDSVAAGATLTTGGKRPEHLDRGWFYEPTVLDAPDASNPGAQIEVFGPVVTVLGYRDLDHAVEISNDSELGLSGGIYTGDLQLGLSVAKRMRTGTVQINTGWSAGYTPMGGYKQSGYGRERGAAGIRSFQELKHIVIGSR